jgi:hypothetical protein
MCVGCKEFNTEPYGNEFDEAEYLEPGLYDKLIEERNNAFKNELNSTN